MAMLDETAVHVIAGGIGGTVGAVCTCPLELIKVRFQSSQWEKFSGHLAHSSPSSPSSSSVKKPTHFKPLYLERHLVAATSLLSHTTAKITDTKVSLQQTTKSELHAPQVFRLCVTCKTKNNKQPACCRGFHLPEASVTSAQPRSFFLRSKIVWSMAQAARTEGVGALFKGLMPTLVGVLPSRGIYFSAYHKGQSFFQQFFADGHILVYMLSAGFGSVTSSTLTCPIWYVKTRLQLDSRPCSKPVTVGQVISTTWRELGFRGFYRGLSASYVGSLETALHFAIYETVKGSLLGRYRRPSDGELEGEFDSSTFRGTQGGSKLGSPSDMALCMAASAFSKAIAITVMYPHEVARTRMRESGNKYRTLVGTLKRVGKDEGFAGLYRGLGTHYIRQLPNTCIVMGTYEVVVFLLESWGLIKPQRTFDITA